MKFGIWRIVKYKPYFLVIRRYLHNLNIMTKKLEESLYKAILTDDQDGVSLLLQQGANPNRTTSHGISCLGEAAYRGKLDIVKLLLDTSKPSVSTNKPQRKRHFKSHKRKLKEAGSHDETIIKCKNRNERSCFLKHGQSSSQDGNPEKNQGYFVFIHSDGSSSDESRKTGIKSPLSPSYLLPSPQDELEWDEEIGNVAPVTSEDETWSSLYQWYAAILECTGAAIASASVVPLGIDHQDAFKKTALHYAALQGHACIVKLLLDAGAKIDATSGDGFTPLHMAVVRNHLDVARMLLEAGSYVNYKTHEKMTSLHFAASRGYVDMVKILVNNGASLEARDTNERTALYLAAWTGHVEVVKYLIISGSNVNSEEMHGYTPLCEAVWQSYSAVVEVLLNSGARITYSHKLLHNAIIQRQVEIVKMLTHRGGGLNLHSDNGDTPLLLAVRLSQPVVARLLLERGADVNACNNITGSSALHIAVESLDNPEDFEQMLLCLLEYNIDMDSTALTGDTALNRALLLHKDYAAVLLICYGADVNASDLQSCGLDNLTITSRRRSVHLTNMLIKAGHHIVPDASTKVPKPGSAAHWLYCTSREPLSLSDICRIKIREVGKKHVMFRYIANLPLPKSIKRYLMMENEFD